MPNRIQQLFNGLHGAVEAHGNRYDPVRYEAYAELAGRPKIAAQIASVFADLGVPRDALILDLAAGTGLLSEALRQQGFRTDALDISLEQISSLQQKRLGGRQGDMQIRWPYHDEGLDGISLLAGSRYLSASGLNHVIAEMQRTLVPDGLVVWPLLEGETFLWRQQQNRQVPADARELARRLTLAGFSTEIDNRYVSPALFQRHPAMELVVARKATTHRRLR